MSIKLEGLQKVIPCKWRVQSYSKKKAVAQCVGYVDARQVANLLDEEVGAGNWQVDYKTINGLLFAGIGIKIDTEWVWKWDTGSETEVEKDKGHVSDAFKRAGVQWGIGRFLYDLKIEFVEANEIKGIDNRPYPIDSKGKRIWDLTKHINKGIKPPKPKEEVMIGSEVFYNIIKQVPNMSFDELIKKAKSKYIIPEDVEIAVSNAYDNNGEELEEIIIED
jgi:hypothetical protein